MWDEFTDAQLIRLRETMLKLVYLNDWDLLLSEFPLETFRDGVRNCRKLSEVVDWMLRRAPSGHFMRN